MIKMASLIQLFILVSFIWTSNGADIIRRYEGTKNVRQDKLAVVGHLGYHFKSLVNEITHNMLMTREISLKPLLKQLSEINKQAEKFTQFCLNEPTFIAPKIENITADEIKGSELKFHYLPEVGEVSRIEARAKCESLGWQLPELYYEGEVQSFIEFMKKTNLAVCHAGLEFDIFNGYRRYIATGLPMWKGAHKFVNDTRSPADTINSIDKAMELLNAEFLYTDKGELHFHNNYKTPVSKSWDRIGNYYRNLDGNERYIADFRTRVVCTNKIRGGKYTTLYRHIEAASMLTYLSHRVYLPGRVSDPKKLGHDDNLSRSPELEAISSRVIESLVKNITMRPFDLLVGQMCSATANLMKEFQPDILNQIIQLLSSVDINTLESVIDRQSNNGDSLEEEILLKSGDRFVPELGSILTMLPSSRVRDDTEIRKTKFNVDDEFIISHTSLPHVGQLSQILGNYSLALTEITLLPKNHRLALEDLSKLMEAMISKQFESSEEVMIVLNRIHNIFEKLSRDINHGVKKLSNIVHSSLMGSTSPYVLSNGRLKHVKSYIKERFVSSRLVEDFSQMKSFIIANEEMEPRIRILVLLTLVETDNSELVQIIPIPHFRENMVLVPVVDHEFVLVNQLAGTQKPLEATEVQNCLINRCSVAGMELPLGHGCGVAQFFGQAFSKCQYRKIHHKDSFVYTAAPHGVIYSFKEPVSTKLVCRNSQFIGKPFVLKGIGSIQVPSECSLSIKDESQFFIKIDSRPMHLHENVGSYVPHVDEIPADKMEVFNITLVGNNDVLVTLKGLIGGNSEKLEVVDLKLLVTYITLSVVTVFTIIFALVVVTRIKRFNYQIGILLNSERELFEKVIEVDQLKEAVDKLKLHRRSSRSSTPSLSRKPQFREMLAPLSKRFVPMSKHSSLATIPEPMELLDMSLLNLKAPDGASEPTYESQSTRAGDYSYMSMGGIRDNTYDDLLTAPVNIDLIENDDSKKDPQIYDKHT